MVASKKVRLIFTCKINSVDMSLPNTFPSKYKDYKKAKDFPTHCIFAWNAPMTIKRTTPIRKAHPTKSNVNIEVNSRNTMGPYALIPCKWRRDSFTYFTGRKIKQGEMLASHCFQLTGKDSRGLCCNPMHIKVSSYDDLKVKNQADRAVKIADNVGDGIDGEDHWEEKYVHPKVKRFFTEVMADI